MTEYGMGDEATIDEVIDDVDIDKVLCILLNNNNSSSILNFLLYSCLRLCRDRFLLCRMGELTMRNL